MTTTEDSPLDNLRSLAVRMEADAADLRLIIAQMEFVQELGSKIGAARHLDTVRPGPDHPMLFNPRRDGHGSKCSADDQCPNMATHTIQQPHGPVQVCTTHFTEWAAARPI